MMPITDQWIIARELVWRVSQRARQAAGRLLLRRSCCLHPGRNGVVRPAVTQRGPEHVYTSAARSSLMNATRAKPAKSLFWADSSTIRARRQVTTDPLHRRTLSYRPVPTDQSPKTKHQAPSSSAGLRPADLRAAIGTVMPGASWQRRRVRDLRNLLARVHKGHGEMADERRYLSEASMAELYLPPLTHHGLHHETGRHRLQSGRPAAPRPAQARIRSQVRRRPAIARAEPVSELLHARAKAWPLEYRPSILKPQRPSRAVADI